MPTAAPDALPACPHCGTNKHMRAQRSSPWTTFMRCERCGLMWNRPAGTDGELEQTYPDQEPKVTDAALALRNAPGEHKPAERPSVMGKHGEMGHYFTSHEGHVLFIPDSAGHVPARVKHAHGSRFTKAEIERAVIDHHKATGATWGPEHDAELEETNASGNPWTFKDRIPSDVKEAAAARGVPLTHFRVAKDGQPAGGADAFAALGDRYIQLAGLASGGTLADALEHAKGSGDPELEMLAHVHANMPESAGALRGKATAIRKRLADWKGSDREQKLKAAKAREEAGDYKAAERLRKQAAKADGTTREQWEKRAAQHEADAGKAGVERIEPNGLRVGDKFEVGGKAFRVAEDGHGLRVLRHGEDYEVPADSFRNGIPADKGTFKPGPVAKKAKAAAVPDDGIPFSRFDPVAGRWGVALARDADPTRKGGKSGGHWVTVGADHDADEGEKGGTPMFIGGDGTIHKGPKGLVGRKVHELSGPHKKAADAKAEAKPEKRAEPLTPRTKSEWAKEAERLADASGMEDDDAKSAALLKRAEAARAKADAMTDAPAADKPAPKAEEPEKPAAKPDAGDEARKRAAAVPLKDAFDHAVQHLANEKFSRNRIVPQKDITEHLQKVRPGTTAAEVEKHMEGAWRDGSHDISESDGTYLTKGMYVNAKRGATPPKPAGLLDHDAAAAAKGDAPSPKVLAKSVEDVGRELAKTSKTGLVPIHQIRAEIAKRLGDVAATHKALDEHVLDLTRKGARVISVSDTRQLSAKQLEDSISDGYETLAYVDFGDAAKGTKLSRFDPASGLWLSTAFVESQHPRAKDGEFSAKGGPAADPALDAKVLAAAHARIDAEVGHLKAGGNALAKGLPAAFRQARREVRASPEYQSFRGLDRKIAAAVSAAGPGGEDAAIQRVAATFPADKLAAIEAKFGKGTWRVPDDMDAEVDRVAAKAATVTAIGRLTPDQKTWWEHHPHREIQDALAYDGGAGGGHREAIRRHVDGTRDDARETAVAQAAYAHGADDDYVDAHAGRLTAAAVRDHRQQKRAAKVAMSRFDPASGLWLSTGHLFAEHLHPRDADGKWVEAGASGDQRHLYDHGSQSWVSMPTHVVAQHAPHVVPTVNPNPTDDELRAKHVDPVKYRRRQKAREAERAANAAKVVPPAPGVRPAAVEPPAPASGMADGLYGQKIIDSSGIGQQAPMFHEPVAAPATAPARVGSASANDPRHTVPMFPAGNNPNAATQPPNVPSSPLLPGESVRDAATRIGAELHKGGMDRRAAWIEANRRVAGAMQGGATNPASQAYFEKQQAYLGAVAAHGKDSPQADVARKALADEAQGQRRDAGRVPAGKPSAAPAASNAASSAPKPTDAPSLAQSWREHARGLNDHELSQAEQGGTRFGVPPEHRVHMIAGAKAERADRRAGASKEPAYTDYAVRPLPPTATGGGHTHELIAPNRGTYERSGSSRRQLAEQSVAKYKSAADAQKAAETAREVAKRPPVGPLPTGMLINDGRKLLVENAGDPHPVRSDRLRDIKQALAGRKVFGWDRDPGIAKDIEAARVAGQARRGEASDADRRRSEAAESAGALEKWRADKVAAAAKAAGREYVTLPGGTRVSKATAEAMAKGSSGAVPFSRFDPAAGRWTATPAPVSGPIYLSLDAPAAGVEVPMGLDSRYPATEHGHRCHYFWKRVITEGDYQHPKTGQRFGVDGKRIAGWAEKAKRMLKLGREIPVPVDHSFKAVDNRGWVVDSRTEVDPQTGKHHLLLLHKMVGDDAGLLAARNRCSIYIDPNYTDEFGEKWGDCVVHSAITPVPVISGQGAFLPMAA